MVGATNSTSWPTPMKVDCSDGASFSNPRALNGVGRKVARHPDRVLMERLRTAVEHRLEVLARKHSFPAEKAFLVAE